jgi:TatD DNase family protein
LNTTHWLDIHTHQPDRPGDSVRSVYNVYYGQQDIDESVQWRSVGFHPWHLDGFGPEAIAWLHEQATRPDVVAIGEAGLDKVTETPFSLQLEAFEACIAIAKSVQKNLIIHCVRAFEEVLQCLKNQHVEGAVFHGFEKKPELALQIVRAGHYLSFGQGLSKPQVTEALKAIPSDRFFLETDVGITPIEDIYRLAAQTLEYPVETVRAQVWKNVELLFGETRFGQTPSTIVPV